MGAATLIKRVRLAACARSFSIGIHALGVVVLQGARRDVGVVEKLAAVAVQAVSVSRPKIAQTKPRPGRD
jgi:hypothetical protein